MRSSAVSAGTDATAAQYNALRLDAQAASYLLAHQQTSPNMTLAIEAGVVNVAGTLVYYAGGNTGTFTAPVSDNRIDIVTIDTAGTIAITQGVAGASPSAPAVPTGKCPIAYVYLRSTSTTLVDTDGGAATGYILRDIRPFLVALEKAAGTDIDTGTDDTKFVTAKALNDSHNTPLVAPGSSGNVMTSNGTDWISSTVPAPVGMPAAGDFSAAARYRVTKNAGATVAYGTSGLAVTGTNAGGYANVYVDCGDTNAIPAYFTGKSMFAAGIQITGIGSLDGVGVACGVGEVRSAGTTWDFTLNHFGFKIIRVSAVFEVYATQADGATEAVSASYGTVTTNSYIEMIAVANGSGGCNYYVQIDGGGWVLKTISTNFPSGAMRFLEFTAGTAGFGGNTMNFTSPSYYFSRNI